jgi:long-subunit fatty acid transport protein
MTDNAFFDLNRHVGGRRHPGKPMTLGKGRLRSAMKLRLILFLVLMGLGLGPCCLRAELTAIEFGTSPNPVGSGARAIGMGGAFIAVADDATAASWNPGGLIQLERPEVSAVGEASGRIESNRFRTNPEASGKQPVVGAGLNYLSAVYPFTFWDHNMVVSLNYQHLFDFSREWNFSLNSGSAKYVFDYEQTGGLYAWGLAYALQITPELSFGFTLNLWDDGLYENGWQQTVGTRVRIPQFHIYNETWKTDRFSFSGFNVNLGALWSINDDITLGAVFKTPFTADLTHVMSGSERSDRRSPLEPVQTVTTQEHLDMPMSFGVGVAYRFSDHLTVSGDIYSTMWQDFILTDAKGRQSCPISGLSARKSHIDPTIQVRTGAEYLIIQPKYVVPLRAGFFYDPAPAEGGSDPFCGATLGTGFAWGRFIFDVAYQARFGFDVGGSILRSLGFSQNIGEHTLYTSMIIHF